MGYAASTKLWPHSIERFASSRAWRKHGAAAASLSRDCDDTTKPSPHMTKPLRWRPRRPEPNRNRAVLFYNRGILFSRFARRDEALDSFRAAIAIDPDTQFAHGHLVYSRMQSCDWQGLGDEVGDLLSRVRAGKCASEPFVLLGYGRHSRGPASICTNLRLAPGAGCVACTTTGRQVSSRSNSDRICLRGSARAPGRVPHGRPVRATRSLSFRDDRDLAGPGRPERDAHQIEGGIRSLRRCIQDGRPGYCARVARDGDRHRGGFDGLYAGCPIGRVRLSGGADPGELSRLFGHDGSGLHRLRARRQGPCAVRPAAVLHGKDRAFARMLHGQ